MPAVVSVYMEICIGQEIYSYLIINRYPHFTSYPYTSPGIAKQQTVILL